MIVGVKKLCLIAILMAEFNLPSGAAKQRKTQNADWYFPVIFSPGTTLSLKFSAIPNFRVKGTPRIVFQPWFPDGSPRARTTADIPIGVTTEVRVDTNYERMDIGWIQMITDHADAFKVEAAYEWTEGNTVR